MERRPWLPVFDPLGIVEELTKDAPVQLRDPLRWRPWRDPIKEVTTFPFIVVAKVNDEVVDYMPAWSEEDAKLKAAKLRAGLEARGWPMPPYISLETRAYRVEALRGW